MSAKQDKKVKVKSKTVQKHSVKAISLWNKPIVWIGLGVILLATFIAYIPAIQNGFVWDDIVYIQKNPLITSINIPEIFSTYYAGNYHPLTILVHAIEFQFFQLNEKGYHIISILFHVANTAMVFFVMKRFTGNVFVTLITTLLFGIHPLHVESVAWISQLKDLLYTFFFLAGLWAYLRYLELKNSTWFILTIFFFLLSLLSKGMAVSFPLVLLLIDYMRGRLSDRKTWLEKIPFFLMSLVFGLIAISAQQSESALHADVIPLMQRIVFAFYGFVQYLIKLVVPFSLSAYYPYPVAVTESIPGIYFLYPVLALGVIGLTIYSIRYTRKVLFGIGFFTVAIIMVLKFLPVGYAIMADRYSYLASVGILYLLAEGLNWLYHQQSIKSGKAITIATLSIMSLFYIFLTFQRCQVWRNSQTLWTDTIKQFPDLPLAHLNLGVDYLDNKKYAEAEKELSEAIRLNPEYADAYYNRGLLYMQRDRKTEALADNDKAIMFNPAMAKAFINRGNLRLGMQQLNEALVDYNKGIELDPSIPEAYLNRGVLHENMSNFDAAVQDYGQAINLNPGYVKAYINRGNIYFNRAQYDSAVADYSQAIQVDPKVAQPYYNRGLAEIKLNAIQNACRDFKSALDLGYTPAGEQLNLHCK